jgi:hypothetical protein
MSHGAPGFNNAFLGIAAEVTEVIFSRTIDYILVNGGTNSAVYKNKCNIIRNCTEFEINTVLTLSKQRIQQHI